MNRLHNWYCNREAWKRHVREELAPAAIDGLDLSGDVLEIGPGFGPATELLAGRAGRMAALEIDPRLAARLRERLGESVEVVDGDATAMPFTDSSFDVVASATSRCCSIPESCRGGWRMRGYATCGSIPTTRA